MIPTVILILLYFGVVSFGYYQTRKLRDFLVSHSAVTEDLAIFIDRQAYFVLTTKFPFSALKEREDGAIWIEESQWQIMIYSFGFLFAVTFITLLFLLFSYV